MSVKNSEYNSSLLIIAGAAVVGVIIYNWNKVPVVDLKTETATLIEATSQPIVKTQQNIENINSKTTLPKDISAAKENTEPPTKVEESKVVHALKSASLGTGIVAGIGVAAYAGYVHRQKIKTFIDDAGNYVNVQRKNFIKNDEENIQSQSNYEPPLLPGNRPTSNIDIIIENK